MEAVSDLILHVHLFGSLCFQTEVKPSTLLIDPMNTHFELIIHIILLWLKLFDIILVLQGERFLI